MPGTILALVAPPDSGKALLIQQLLMLFPHQFERIRTVTDRLPLTPDELAAYRFVTSMEYRQMQMSDRFIHQHRDIFDKSEYGFDRDEMDTVLSRRHGICAMSPKGVEKCATLGYRIQSVRVVPKKGPFRGDLRDLAYTQATDFRANFEVHLRSDDVTGAIKRIVRWANSHLVIDQRRPGNVELFGNTFGLDEPLLSIPK